MPKERTAAEAMGEGTCRTVSPNSEPLVIDWKSHERTNLEEAMGEGVAVVSYDCKSLSLVKDCHVDGTYGFFGVTKKEEVIQLEDGDEIRANLPAFGIKMTAGLERNSTLDLALIMIGKKRTTVKVVARPQLKGSCDGATHFVRGAFLGAFAMGTGTRGTVSAAVDLFGAGAQAESRSSRKARSADGEPKECATSTTGAPSPPANCSALLRLELAAITPGQAKPKSGADAEDLGPVCPTGMVRTNGKCTLPENTKTFECRRPNAAECKEQCDLGNGPSCSNLAFMILFKEGGLSRDEARANQLLSKACDQKVSKACGQRALHLARGIGGPKDEAKALTFFKESCDAGDSASCANYGMMHMLGIGVFQDKKHAVELFQRSCDGGNENACNNVGIAYMQGDGVSKDPARSVGFFKRACDADNQSACTELARAHIFGRGTAKNPQEAVRLLNAGCSDDEQKACDLLGMMNRDGLGIPKSAQRAVTFFTNACKAGLPQACDNLGSQYQNGEGVAKDVAKAAELFKKACDEGVPEGCFDLGEVYERGEGVTKDIERGKTLYRKACDRGLSKACDAAKRLGSH